MTLLSSYCGNTYYSDNKRVKADKGWEYIYYRESGLFLLVRVPASSP